jgi:hypothetical protein
MAYTQWEEGAAMGETAKVELVKASGAAEIGSAKCWHILQDLLQLLRIAALLG